MTPSISRLFLASPPEPSSRLRYLQTVISNKWLSCLTTLAPSYIWRQGDIFYSPSWIHASLKDKSFTDFLWTSHIRLLIKKANTLSTDINTLASEICCMLRFVRRTVTHSTFDNERRLTSIREETILAQPQGHWDLVLYAAEASCVWHRAGPNAQGS